MSRVAQRVEEWKRKIVDLSRRNRSLYFARTRGSTLKITEPSLSDIFNHLVNSEKAWEFYMPPDAPEAASKSDLDNTQPSLLENQEGKESKERAGEIPADRDDDELLTDIEDGSRLSAVSCATYIVALGLISRNAGFEFSFLHSALWNGRKSKRAKS